ncbi:protein CHLOROPLAST J-LIKE DOMAIN 1, chloroplastic-like [Phragmites australis]|uniref:protein CHLOROPLAST J-LIKE DOMAIN 1, chloroplastic-like n=1 Tax=Phragmites australis TaxID=29695 RepID=UPI002D773385|nr:protein CHLOROPLAST J-LIKE DOMAIN 1, chloroplastic-like [Phragmites australis]
MAAATATTAAAAPAFALASSLSRRGFLPLPRRVGRPVPLSLRLVASAVGRRRGVVVVAAAAAGSAEFGDEENPYELLGIRPLDSFDHMKMAYKKKRKDADETGDEELLAKLDRAYDTVMMQQLQYRKKGVTYGSVQVSKDIKYADNQPIVPWGPRFSRSTVKDMRINMVISAALVVWIALMGNADWKPLQFLCFAFFYRILQKLRATEPPITPIYNEYGEVEGRGIRMAKRVVRALGLIFGCVFTASLGYTAAVNLIEFSWQYTPRIVYYYQELIVTAATSVLLDITASYYR